MVDDEQTNGEWGGALTTAATLPPARAFAPEELVACAACARQSPPTRANCIYCGHALSAPARLAESFRPQPPLHSPEESGKGFNVVLSKPAHAPSEATLTEAASLLRLDAEKFRELIGAGATVPLARTATGAEAAHLQTRLAALGLRVAVMPDETLCGAGAHPVRVRRLHFTRDELEGWAGGGAAPVVIACGDVTLLLRGQLLVERLEVEERSTRFGTQRDVADERKLYADAQVLDLFAGESHWRFVSDAFDYSCLGGEKSLLAKDNFETLVRRLRNASHDAAYDDNYARLRRLLAAVWPPSEHVSAGGLRRERPGKLNVEVATIVSNETQFTRYARMLHLLTINGRRT